MRIQPTTHEHGVSGKVYTYEGEYDVGDSAITWRATVSHAEEPPRSISGTIPITSPAMTALADKVVCDAVVKAIDGQRATAAHDATTAQPETPPSRTPLHDALQVFVGQWRAEGLSYGGPEQSDADPKGQPVPWRSTHTTRWHTGRFFLIEDEQAVVGGDPFDTVGIIGVDAKTGQLFAHCFENHGFERRYDLSASGACWTFSGPSERATIEFSADGRTQHVVWEWRPRTKWLPLCERTAVRVD
jgi:Protein of unknown function (DUF1579)